MVVAVPCLERTWYTKTHFILYLPSWKPRYHLLKGTFEDVFLYSQGGICWFLGGYTDGASAQVTDFLEHWDLSMTKEAGVGRICKTRTKNPPVWLI